MPPYTRRQFVRGCLGAAAAASLSGAARSRPAAAQGNPSNGNLNVVLFYTDDQSAHLGCLGTRGLQTPHADALARDGVLFHNTFATCASCAPARGSILTGTYPSTNGHWRNTHGPGIGAPEEEVTRESSYKEIEEVGVHEDIPTLPEILNEAGYVTAITQKWHLSPPWKFPYQRRFSIGPSPASYREAMESLLEARNGRPFFLQANTSSPHRPFSNQIVDIDIPPVEPDDVELPPMLADTPKMREDFAQYLTAIQCADACLGAVLEVLGEAGELDRTLIIFTSDQGYCYHRAKATLYDDGTRVPFIVKGPGIDAGRETDALISHVDVLPTILDYAGIETPDTAEGRSLRPWLEGATPAEWREYVVTQHHAHGPPPDQYYPIRAIYDGRMQYIRNLAGPRSADTPLEEVHLDSDERQDIFWAGPADAYPGGHWGNQAFEATVEAREKFPLQYEILQATLDRPGEELYDLHGDPGSLRNFADDERYQAHKKGLSAALDEWMEAHDDPGVEVRDIPRRTDPA